MQASKVMMTVGSALASSSLGRDVKGIELNDVLGLVGLARRRSYLLQNLALVSVGAAVGAGIALLLAPASGGETRKRLSQGVEKLTEQAAETLQQAQHDISNLDNHANNTPSYVA